MGKLWGWIRDKWFAWKYRDLRRQPWVSLTQEKSIDEAKRLFPVSTSSNYNPWIKQAFIDANGEETKADQFRSMYLGEWPAAPEGLIYDVHETTGVDMRGTYGGIDRSTTTVHPPFDVTVDPHPKQRAMLDDNRPMKFWGGSMRRPW